MLPSDLATQASHLLLELEAAEPLVAALTRFAEVEEQIVQFLDKAAAGGQEATAVGGPLHGLLANARQVLPQLPSRGVYKAIDRAVEALRTYASYAPDSRTEATKLVERLEKFTEVYEAYLGDQSAKRAVSVLRLAPAVLTELLAFRTTLAGIRREVGTSMLLADDEEMFSVFFPGEQSLEDAAQRLQALSEIFNLVGELVLPKHPPPYARVLRIEFGSMLVDLAIVRSIAKIAGPWVKAIAGFLYRNWTIEGAIGTAPSAARAAIKDAVDVRKLLQKEGINTSGMDAQISIAAEQMGVHVAHLIRNQHRFKVGEEDFDVSRSVLESIEYSEPPKLPPPSKADDRLPPPTK
jgi:hypothetical protein